MRMAENLLIPWFSQVRRYRGKESSVKLDSELEIRLDDVFLRLRFTPISLIKNNFILISDLASVGSLGT